MTIQTVCVCGAGTMGSGIAQLCAQSAFNTILFEVDSSMNEKATSAIEGNLSSLIEKGKLNSKLQVLERIRFTNNIDDCRADLVIEAIIEKEEAKVSLFKQLEAINS